MAQERYDTAHASECYINIAKDGSVEAGMILENGEVLNARLPVGEHRVECTKEILEFDRAHRLVLERDEETIVREYSYFGLSTIVEEFDISITRGSDYWLGGSSRRS